MKTFKQYLEERKLMVGAALAIAGSAMALPPKPEALEKMVEKMKEREGFRPIAVRDDLAKGKPIVVGFGTTHVYPKTGKPIKLGDTMTKEQGEENIRSFFKNMTPGLEKIPGWDDMDAGKQSAILSFGYNAGQNFYGADGYETITKNLKDKDYDAVPETLKKYNKGDGEILPGLVTRREEEGNMWKSGDAPKPPKVKAPVVKAPVVAEPVVDDSEHTVVSGDNLYRIAKDRNTTVDEILKKNPDITDPNMIKPGQKIKTK